ncbi:YbaB/EbfC family nucleoid-associated protein [Candidatus Parcubacteria bacterium]|jgi:DNA-binding YbaB/EbfC family protein|nr:YbaB/EbfC family nucleoid-associated protein [Candidatus Parcubacteria bacterium]MBT3948552.1 YbaB/EbfC family nucleoid-associated protein [Candidatus Parcubacteria bacterium]
MFNKLKQFKDMRDQAKTMQDALAGESVTVKSNGVELTMNGNLEVTDIVIDDDLMSPDKKVKLQSAIIDAHKDALKKMQRIMAMKMKEMGGMPNIPGMS